MTFRLVIAIDPGITGAIAVLADGKVDSLHDMPIRPRKSGTNEVNPSQLVEIIREVRSRHVGAAELCCIEDVAPMPSKKDGKGMGATSAFQYGRGLGVVEGVLEALRVPIRKVHAQTWKRHAGLIGQEKDLARTAAITRHPAVADHLKRKKDCARAEAILIAEWGQREMGHQAGVSDDPFDLNPAAVQQSYAQA